MKKIYSLLFLLSLLIMPLSVFAEATTPPTSGGNVVQESTHVDLPNPLAASATDNVTLNTVFSRIIKSFLGLAGVFALIMFIYGGFQWMTAAGDPKKVTKGKDTVLWATLGILLIFASRSLLNLLLNALK